jgi:hypothetical protein
MVSTSILLVTSFDVVSLATDQWNPGRVSATVNVLKVASVGRVRRAQDL